MQLLDLKEFLAFRSLKHVLFSQPSPWPELKQRRGLGGRPAGFRRGKLAGGEGLLGETKEAIEIYLLVILGREEKAGKGELGSGDVPARKRW